METRTKLSFANFGQRILELTQEGCRWRQLGLFYSGHWGKFWQLTEHEAFYAFLNMQLGWHYIASRPCAALVFLRLHSQLLDALCYPFLLNSLSLAEQDAPLRLSRPLCWPVQLCVIQNHCTDCHPKSDLQKHIEGYHTKICHSRRMLVRRYCSYTWFDLGVIPCVPTRVSMQVLLHEEKPTSLNISEVRLI